MSRQDVPQQEIAGVLLTPQIKPIKYLRLRVDSPSGEVKLSVPRGTPKRVVEQFVGSRRAWIVEQQAKARQAASLAPTLRNGGRARLWGQWREIVLTESTRATARFHDGQLLLRAPDEAGAARALDRLYRSELRRELQRCQHDWERAVGRAAASIKLRRMTSRWGTCNTKTKAITLNVTLAEWPGWALEYVLVHELVHLLEPGHGPRFQAHMSRVLPDWRDRRRDLRNSAT